MKRPDWEEGFDLTWGTYDSRSDSEGLDKKLKDFIRSLLAAQKAELLEKLDKLSHESFPESYGMYWNTEDVRLIIQDH